MTVTRKAKVGIESVQHEDGSTSHTLSFTNGQKRVVSFDKDHKLAQRFRLHGERAKLLATANSGKEADESVQKVDKLVDAFDEGKWSLIGEDGPKQPPLVLALAEVTGKSIAEAASVVAGLTKGQQAKLRGTERIAAIIARIKGAEGNEGDDLLDGLLDSAEGNVTEEAA